MKEMKAADKVTQKMTRDGAVTENLATGEVTNISGREAEVDLSSEQEPAATAEAVAERATHAHDRRKAKQAARADAETVRAGSEARSRPSSRLQFTEEERQPRICRKRSGALTGRRIGWTRRRPPSPQRRC